MKFIIPICLLMAITTTLMSQTESNHDTRQETETHEGEIFLPAAYTPTSASCTYTCCVINGVQINVVGTIKNLPGRKHQRIHRSEFRSLRKVGLVNFPVFKAASNQELGLPKVPFLIAFVDVTQAKVLLEFQPEPGDAYAGVIHDFEKAFVEILTQKP